MVERIARETSGLAAGITRLEREIELLREYRARLVADVVTGKLDVRAAAAEVPEFERTAEMPAGVSDAAEFDVAEAEEADE